MSTRGWLVTVGVFLLSAIVSVAVLLGTRAVLRHRLRRWARNALRQFQARTDRYKLVERDRIREALLQDPQILAAIAQYAEAHGTAESQVRIRVNQYVDEIVPFFNVLSYYRFGYNLSRLLINLLYKSTIEYRDQEALDRIPRRDVVVYLMNHRSNADYVVVAYVLARVVSISYAVGEWARTWPLEFVFKSFGSYFIRRQFREPLYHSVLERYVQLITRNGVTQGIFPEGGLSRDGALRPVKIGLLDYIVRTIDDPAFDRDIWLVPVGINYDRVLEDRSLIRERIVGGRRPSRLTQLGNVLSYLGWNTLRLFTGQLKRYGRVAIAFGTPISVRAALGEQPAGILALPKPERLPHIQRLAEAALERIGAVIPVTPVPLASAALLSFGASVVPLPRLLERLDDIRDRLGDRSARVVRTELPVSEVWDRAWLMFSMRRLVMASGNDLVILPSARPLLEYYANSIRHLLPPELVVNYSPAGEGDTTLPRLATRAEMDIMTKELPVLPKRGTEQR
ncbi:MAG: 1-acyl-sn-glycerol-3-phosphate acyltransferase [Gemmatimonadota bacterium]